MAVVGPFSRASILANCDANSRAGRVMKSTLDAIMGDLGRETTAGQRLLAQAVALKSTRLSLLAERLVTDTDQSADERAISWLNSMRLDLQALGALQHRQGKMLDLKSYIASKDAEELASP